MHDPRIGRFFAVDPLAAKYPWNSPYSFQENKIGLGRELEGLQIGPPLSAQYHMAKASGISVTEAADILWMQNGAALQAMQHVLLFTDVNDATVLVTWAVSDQAINTDLSFANNWDKGFAIGGLFLPYVSGSTVRRVLKGFNRLLDASEVGIKNADKFFQSEGVKTMKEFYEKTRKLDTNERIVKYKEVGGRVADGNNWEKSNKLSKKHSRDVYTDSDGNIYSLDTRHGEFEVLNKSGEHQGAINFEGVKTKNADASHNMDIK